MDTGAFIRQNFGMINLQELVNQIYLPEIIIFDDAFEVYYISPKAEKYTLTLGGHLPKLNQLFQPSLFEAVKSAWDKFKEEEELPLTADGFYHLNGDKVEVSVTLNPFIGHTTDLKKDLFVLQLAEFISLEKVADSSEEEEKVSESQVRETINKYQKVFNNPYHGVIIFDASISKPVDCNELALEIFGCETKEQFLNEPAQTFTAEIQAGGIPVQEFIAEKFQLAIVNDKVEYESIGRKLDGSYFQSEVTIYKDFDGDRKHIILFIQDVTEKKRIESKAKLNQEQLQLAQQIGNIGSYYLDPNTQRLNCSEQMLRIFGLDRNIDLAEYMGHIHPDDANEHLRLIRRLMLYGQEFQSDVRVFKSDGSIGFVFTSGKAIRDQEGRILEVVGTVQDISERKMNEQKIASSEALFRSFYEQSPLGVVMIHDINISRLNERFAEILGYKSDELIDRNILDLTYEEDIDLTKKKIEGLYLDIDKAQTYEKRYVNKEGKLVWVRINSTILNKDSAKGNLYLGLIEDISKEKEIQKALEESEERYRTLFEHGFEGIIIRNLHTGELLSINPTMLGYLGCTENEFRALGPLHFAPTFQPSGEKSKDLYQKLIASIVGRTRFQYDWTFNKSDGSLGQAEVSVYALPQLGEGVYVSLVKDVTQQRFTQDALETISRDMAMIPSEAFFDLLVQIIANVIKVKYVIIGEYDKEKRTISSKAFWNNGKLDKIEYSIEGTPCDLVLTNDQLVYYPEKIVEFFPDDEDLKTLGVSSLMGYPLRNSQGKVIGNIIIMNDGPITYPETTENLLQIYSAKISAEIERTNNAIRLAESESRYRFLFENAFDGIVIWDNEHKSILNWNHNLLKRFSSDKSKLAKKIACLLNDGGQFEFNGKPLMEEVEKEGKVRIFTSVDSLEEELIHVEISIFKVGPSLLTILIKDITHQKVLEEERQEMFRQQSMILDSLPVHFWVKDKNNHIIRANKTAASSINSTVDEVVGKSAYDLHPEYAEVYYQDDLEVINSQKPKLGIIEQYKTVDGPIWMRTDKTPYLDAEGEVQGVIVYSSDITELVHAQIMTRENEEKYRKLFETSDDGILIVDWQQGCALECNHAYMNLFSASKRQILEGNTLVFSPEVQPDGSPSAQKLHEYRKAARTKTIKYEWTFKKTTQEEFIAEVIVSPFPFKDRELGIFILRDISERKQKEEALKASEALRGAVLNAIPDMIFWLNKDGIVSGYSNKEVEKLFPESLDNYVGQHVDKMLPKDIAHQLVQKINEAFEKGEVLAIHEQINSHEEGASPFYYEIRVNPINDNEAIAIMRDITIQTLLDRDLKQEIALKEAQKVKLEQYIKSNMQLENFAYIASHDLREPLLTTQNFASLLKKRYGEKLDEKGRLFVDYIVSSTENMKLLINELLAFSRIQTDKEEAVEVDIEELLSEIVQGLDTTIQRNRGTITIGKLPASIMGSRMKLKQLFQNLLSNGVKFKREGVNPAIELSCKSKDEFWHFSIKDNGIGIDPKYHQKIFLLFRRLHNKGDFGGTGIGLALCKEIVAQHGGEIWVESELGEGSCFHFTLLKSGILDRFSLE